MRKAIMGAGHVSVRFNTVSINETLERNAILESVSELWSVVRGPLTTHNRQLTIDNLS
ncbi:hypothetical protein [Algoriphagus mannitolivorans]|uniref:hypothetical protein n=1 Tax=Algoriphagus mannitolivorans TaxID=226504 RepID=UPI0012F8FBED|nr:hypothetical protein [Algoriphagus mannitolivorans]